MIRIVVIGAGSIGSRTVKLIEGWDAEIFVIDRDIVMEENIQNQLYTEELLGEPKPYALQKEFPHIRALATELTEETSELLKSDLVLDCVDNIATRRIINNFCVEHGIPWIHSAAINDKAQVMAIIPSFPCFESVFNGKKDGLTCEADNINPEAAELAAKLQVELAKRVLTNESFQTKLIQETLDGKHDEYTVKKDTLPYNYEIVPQKMCGSNMYQFRKQFEINEPYKREKDAWLFKDGRILIKAKNEKEAKEKLRSVLL